MLTILIRFLVEPSCLLPHPISSVKLHSLTKGCFTNGIHFTGNLRHTGTQIGSRCYHLDPLFRELVHFLKKHSMALHFIVRRQLHRLM